MTFLFAGHFFPLFFLLHTEYSPYSHLNSSWHEVDSSVPPTPTLFHSLANILCYLPSICFLLCLWFSSDKRSHRPPLISSDSRYAFTATNRFWFHRSAGLERGIQSILIPYFRYDMIRHEFQRHQLARRSSVPPLEFGYWEMWGKIPATLKNQNGPENNANADDPSYFFTPEPYPVQRSPSLFQVLLSSYAPARIDQHEIVHRIYRTGSDLKVQNLPSSHFYLLRENAAVIDARIRFRGELWDFIRTISNTSKR